MAIFRKQTPNRSSTYSHNTLPTFRIVKSREVITIAGEHVQRDPSMSHCALYRARQVFVNTTSQTWSLTWLIREYN